MNAPSSVNHVSSIDNVVDTIRFEKELTYLKSMQPKLTRLEFPKFNGVYLHEWLYKLYSTLSLMKLLII